MNPRLRRSAAHVFVASLDAPELSADDAHHLGRVLRVRPTDELTVSDGCGRWAAARWTASGGLERTSDVVEEPAPSVVAVVTAIPKGDRPEWVVQKLTELGVDTIGFTVLARSVVRWDANKVDRQLDRLRRIAREAAMQSRRVRLPEIRVLAWDEVVGLPGVALAEPDGRPWDDVAADDSASPPLTTLVIGPEGGFTSEELAAVPRTVALSDQVLRVETAAVVAGVLLRRRHG